jgi:hypothetical protein
VPTVEVAQVEICDDREDDEHDEEGEVTAQAAGVGGGFGGGVEVWSILFKRKRMMLVRGCFVVGGGNRGCVPDDVADRLADEDHSVGEGAFGVACGVLRR